jgi:hypothetical protein
MKAIIIKGLLALNICFSIILIALPTPAEAQCPMCRMSAEADLKNGGTNAKGLNAGIMYMLGFPYILLGTIGYIWYNNRRRVAAFEQDRDLRALLEPYPGETRS